jgi:hypothetical protein
MCKTADQAECVIHSEPTGINNRLLHLMEAWEQSQLSFSDCGVLQTHMDSCSEDARGGDHHRQSSCNNLQSRR